MTMYTNQNFRSKKAFKDAVAEGKQITIKDQSIFTPQDLSKFSGRVAVSGPWYPEPHKWYAEVDLKDGIVTKVK